LFPLDGGSGWWKAVVVVVEVVGLFNNIITMVMQDRGKRWRGCWW